MNYAVHPGSLIKMLLMSTGKNQNWLSKEMKVSKVVVSELIHGKRNITPQMAIAIEKAIGYPAQNLVRLQGDYDLFIERQKNDNQVTESFISKWSLGEDADQSITYEETIDNHINTLVLAALERKIKNIKSGLKINNLFFSDLIFNRSEKVGKDITINNSLGVEYEEISDNGIIVKIRYEAKSDDMSINVVAVINGVFELTNAKDLQPDVKNYILKVNTLAILISYLRSQVVLLTSQPGFNPIQIPIINAESLYKNSQKK